MGNGGERLWCVIARAENYYDFAVWGPYASDETDATWERLADRADAGKLVLFPMSRDWDAEEALDA